MFYWIVKGLFWPFGRIYLRMRIEGDVPRKGPVILAANHVSVLDPAVLGSACPRAIRFLMTRRLYDPPLLRWFYRGMRAIPLRATGEADPGALREALRCLRAGQVVGIFPEGPGIDPAGGMRSPRSGAALIAVRAGVPVVPVAIEGTWRSMPRGTRIPRPGRVTVRFGEPFQIEQDERRASRDWRRKGVEEMMRRIGDLLDTVRASA